MFALHTPQTITLTEPGEDGPFTLINFRTNGADSSRCVMEITTPDGHLHRLTFTTRGHLVDQQFIDKDHPEHEAKHLTETDYIVDGRDTRADNPYTHVAPVSDDVLYRDGPTPGEHRPVPLDGDGKPVVDDHEMRPKAMEEAEKNAQHVREEREKIARESPEDRRKRLDAERAERLKTGNLKTAEDTTAGDVSWDAPHATEIKQPAPDTAFMNVHGRVNTTESMTTPAPHDEFAGLRPLAQPEPQHGA